MQYIYENFTFPPDQSFTIRSEILEVKKYTSLKSHINFEIALLENCSGKRFIGDHIHDFEGTELVLLGSYLPHCWQYYKTIDPMIQPQAIVIHFFPDFLGKQLLEKPEAKKLNELFDKAAKGVSFSGETVAIAKMLMQQMLFETGLRPGAHGRAARRAQPRPARAARHGADGHRRMLVFDHLRHELTILACAFADEDGGIDAAYERAAAAIAEVRERLRGAVPVPARPSVRRAAALRLEHGARGVRSGGRADRRVRPRRRRLPGRALAALLRAGPGRGLLDLPRPARGQPLALHVLPRVRRLPDRRRLAGAAGQGHRAPGGDAADRRHLPARGAARRRTAASPSAWSTTPRSGPST